MFSNDDQFLEDLNAALSPGMFDSSSLVVDENDLLNLTSELS